ncbi:MAG: sulfotransferase domain-containing protein [Proteobacteria bacterium]|nr:sulfotransferase domain-containing protein [Pseudomonadota bacterium]
MSSLKLAARLRPQIRGVLGPGMEYRLRRTLARITPASHPLRDTHFVHCTTARAASQWVRLMLSDPWLYRYHGHLPYAGRDMPKRLPRGAMVTSQYWNTADLRRFRESNGPARAIFVVRDPRDLVVSWYFSSRYGHDAGFSQIEWRRARMAGMTEDEGLAHMIERFLPIAVNMWSWAKEAQDDPSVRIVRYEDLTGTGKRDAWRGVFGHFGFAVPDGEIARLLEYYSLDNLKAAPVNASGVSRYRTARAGGWQAAMSPANRDRFLHLHGKLVEAFGYD